MSVFGWLGATLAAGMLLLGASLLLITRLNKNNLLLSQDFDKLVDRAKLLGLPDYDIVNITSLLKYAEYGVAFNVLVEQLYEHTIIIDAAYYQLLQSIAEKLKMPEQEYIFAKELVV